MTSTNNNPYMSYLKQIRMKNEPLFHLFEDQNEKSISWILTLPTYNINYLRVVLEPERIFDKKSTFLYLVEAEKASEFRNQLKMVFEKNPFNTRGSFPEGENRKGIKIFGGLRRFSFVHQNFEKWKERRV